MKKTIEDKLRGLGFGDIVEITTKGGDSFFARFWLGNHHGQFTFHDGHGALMYHSSGKSWGVDHPSESSAIADVRAINQGTIVRFLSENKELFKKAEKK